MSLPRTLFAFVALAVAGVGPAARAQTPPAAAPVPSLPAAPAVRTTPVGFPQDAGPHDASAAIEWWYYNAFLTGKQTGRRYAVVCSFFRTGIGSQKGHYLIYALTDLDRKTKTTASILDKANLDLLKAYLPFAATLRPGDARLTELMARLQKGELPPPHQSLPTSATVTTNRPGEPFAITLGASRLRCASADGRTWQATLKGNDFALDLTLRQPARPAMLVGGVGKTGLTRPDDMFYVSLTRMAASGSLTRRGGKTEAVAGDGWLDRQWGTSWVVQDTGWDWLGLQLSDGSDLIVYRVKDNATGAIRRAEATLLKPDGTQVVDRAPTFTPSGAFTDPASGVTYPQTFRIALPALGLSLTTTPAFPDQTIPVVGIGDAIWEGVVNVSGKTAAGAPVGGRGYMELVGYRAKAASGPNKAAAAPTPAGARR